MPLAGRKEDGRCKSERAQRLSLSLLARSLAQGGSQPAALEIVERRCDATPLARPSSVRPSAVRILSRGARARERVVVVVIGYLRSSRE